MEKITIGTTHRNGVIKILSQFFNITNDIKKCDIFISENEKIEPIDIFYAKLKNIPILGGERLDKIYQYLFLKKHNIPTPKTFFNESTLTPIKDIYELDAYVDLDEFVIKPYRGARGILVKKIDRKTYRKHLHSSINYSSYNEIYPDLKDTFKAELEYCKSETIKDAISNPDSYLIDIIKHGEFLIQEVINIEREFRVLYFKDDFLIYEREKNGQFLGNISSGCKSKSVDNHTIEKYIKPLLKKINPLMDELNYPWLSLDVYISGDTVGIIEFQMEFAYEGFYYKDVREKLKNCIHNYVKI